VVQGKHAFLADEPMWFAEYCLSLLNNPEGAHKLGRAAYEFAQEYDWRRVIPAFEQVYKTAAKRDG
jgi:glycosyltransferase involved in cell wall biosynthesis